MACFLEQVHVEGETRAYLPIRVRSLVLWQTGVRVAQALIRKRQGHSFHEGGRRRAFRRKRKAYRRPSRPCAPVRRAVTSRR